VPVAVSFVQSDQPPMTALFVRAMNSGAWKPCSAFQTRKPPRWCFVIRGLGGRTACEMIEFEYNSCACKSLVLLFTNKSFTLQHNVEEQVKLLLLWQLT